MLNEYSYDARIRKAIAVFGSLFNNINVRNIANGDVYSEVRVPIMYGPRSKILAAINEDPDHKKIALSLPRMSFEITSINPKVTENLNKYKKSLKRITTNDSKVKVVPQRVIYTIGIGLSVYGKSMDHTLQIIEQILPYFNPDYSVTIKDLIGSKSMFDSNILLTSVSPVIEYENSLDSGRNINQFVLEFSMDIPLLRPIQDQNVIREVSIDFYEIDTDEAIDRVTCTVGNDDHSESYTPVTTIGLS